MQPFTGPVGRRPVQDCICGEGLLFHTAPLGTDLGRELRSPPQPVIETLRIFGGVALYLTLTVAFLVFLAGATGTRVVAPNSGLRRCRFGRWRAIAAVRAESGQIISRGTVDRTLRAHAAECCI